MNNLVNMIEPYILSGKREKLELMDYYNDNCFELVKKSRRYRIQPSDNWCAMFTSVFAHKAGLGANSFPYEVSVMEQVKIANERGIFTTDKAEVKPNDLVIFDWNRDGWADHVGFVNKIDDSLLTSLEGNINGTVNYRTISSNSKAIFGYIKVDKLHGL